MDKNKFKTFNELLATFLGLEPQDIKPDDHLVEHLHMHASELSDFIALLEENGFDFSNVDLSKIETVNDLMEAFDIDVD